MQVKRIVTRLFKKIIQLLIALRRMDQFRSQERHYSEDSCTSTPVKTSSYAGLYQLIRRIQIGGQAGIYLSSKFSTIYALKIYNEGQTCEKEFQNEVRILQRLNYKGTVPIVQIINNALFKWEEQQQRSANIIVMPYIENGDLFQWISKNGTFTQSTGRYFAKKLIETFRYLAQENIFHRDIKPENILLDHNYNPLLVDFGYSIDRRQKDNRFIGDIRYASPQVIKHIEYTEKSEVYSFAILLFFIITGKFPYGMARVSDPNYRLLLERKYKEFWGRVQLSIKRNLSTEFKQTFAKMISPNSSQRPTFQSILQHSWLTIEETSSQEYQRYMESLRVSKYSQ